MVKTRVVMIVLVMMVMIVGDDDGDYHGHDSADGHCVVVVEDNGLI